MSALQAMAYDEFRRKLAGFEDKDRVTPDDIRGYRTDASTLCRLLAELFGDELDRLTLWSRIDSAIRTSCAKATDGNLELLVNLCLEHVKADAGRASGNEDLERLLLSFNSMSDEKRRGFAAYLKNNTYSVIVHGKSAWEIRKGEMKSKSKAKAEAEEVTNG